ncbi:MAG TPA: DUF2975 domain-containing protein [Caulobacteraceae bacterium]|nr:DUF2975 domain-containing protein [Caulobacteraceae bacterium]
MRALGPGSVSSFLKVIVEAVRFVLWVVAGFVALLILAALLLSIKPDWLGALGLTRSLHVPLAWVGPAAAAALFALDLYLAGAIVIVTGLCRIFQTLVAGDPFHPDNVRRLRIIGLTLALLEVGRYAAAGIVTLVPHVAHISVAVNFTAWFAVLVIFVLAEVFREGARLRREAELTI